MMIPVSLINYLIKGESGSGKTTLLYRLALLSDQSDYEYHINKYDDCK